jgi:hypothetical protein
MLVRLAYLGIANAFALLRLLPGSDQDKDAEIRALPHQLAVLQRQLDGQRVRFDPADRAWPAALLHRYSANASAKTSRTTSSGSTRDGGTRACQQRLRTNFSSVGRCAVCRTPRTPPRRPAESQARRPPSSGHFAGRRRRAGGVGAALANAELGHEAPAGEHGAPAPPRNALEAQPTFRPARRRRPRPRRPGRPTG